MQTEVEDSHDAVEMFNQFLTESFEQKNVKVVASGAVAEAKMTIVIKHLTKVSKTSKFFLGPLTGAAKLKAEIAIITGGNKFNFSLNSSAIDNMGDAIWWIGRSGSTDDLLERTSKKITEEILL